MSSLKDRMLAPRVPDLTKPSLEGIAYVLRHKELWPKNFQWDFAWRPTCALGLGDLLWPEESLWWEDKFVDGHTNIFNAFYVGGYLKTSDQVADELDRALSKLPK